MCVPSKGAALHRNLVWEGVREPTGDGVTVLVPGELRLFLSSRFRL